MRYRCMQQILPVLFSSLLLCFSLQAPAASLEGIHFDDTTKMANTELRLNGLGVRAVLWLKGYVAGLYLTEKTNSQDGVLQATGPKRIQIKMLIDVSSEEFRKALVNGIRNNVSPAGQLALQSRIEQFESAIAEVGVVKKGDTITLDFVPDKGLSLRLNERPKGGIVPGADFFNAVLSIFVGHAPVDAKLKRGLLGQAV